MFIDQLSVFMENQPGKLAAVTDILGKNGVDIRAISISDTRDFGILRLIVDQPDKAADCLKAAGSTVSITQVIAIGIDDTPGCLAAALQILSERQISVEYAYAYLSKSEKPASIILRVSDNQAAVEALQEHGIKVLENQEIANL